MFLFKLNFLFRNICLSRSVSTHMFIEQLNKRTILRLSGPDTSNYLQSMITNDIKVIENSSSIFSLLLNARGRVLYDILLYKLDENEYLVEYDATAVAYLHKHLLMYRLRKNVEMIPTNDFTPWVIYPNVEQNITNFSTVLHSLANSVKKQDGIVSSVVDPRTNLLGVRVITHKVTNLLPSLMNKNINFSEGKTYRIHRYKLGVGEGVIDHPTGVCLPSETNFDILNGVSFSKGCYIGQELTARLHFTMNITKRLMPVVLEEKNSYPEFLPEASIVNEKGEKLGRLRCNVGPFGLALLKHEEALKATFLSMKDFDIKLKANKPKWWPNDVNSKV